MRFLSGLLSASVIALSACSPRLSEEQSLCWLVARELLRSPSSAKLISAADLGVGEVKVDIDADNAYGTPVRTVVSCVVVRSGAALSVKSASVDGEPVNPFAVIAADIRVATNRIK